jgi:hypothetical protein
VVPRTQGKPECVSFRHLKTFDCTPASRHAKKACGSRDESRHFFARSTRHTGDHDAIAGAPQKPGPYLRSGAVTIAEPRKSKEETAIKSQAIHRDAAEESITIDEVANCGPTEKLKNGLRINHWWQ